MTRKIYPQTDEIVYLEAQINYTILHLKNGRKIVSSTTLKYHQADSCLDGFLRVHRSYLINPDFIKNIVRERTKTIAQLLDGRELEVSRRRVELVKNLRYSIENTF
ncbi:LytTR family DNA-binding domain-containing protein [Emticicia sp. BO119]|uniref:LytR/AlgR family response regulator transcription factor n=1 Tax=Emticicia sp. BO119 TaxID=2757768 RepID=UPI0015F0240F|nr:LytTR family DNA-binding domain-containing protein [Emticicia sp. BO119]MBA4850566.1 LytTR family transcriptional regulator [Emticicia sp. BO119]